MGELGEIRVMGELGKLRDKRDKRDERDWRDKRTENDAPTSIFPSFNSSIFQFFNLSILPSFNLSSFNSSIFPSYSGLYPKLSSSRWELRQSLSTFTKSSKYIFFPKKRSKDFLASEPSFFSATP